MHIFLYSLVLIRYSIYIHLNKNERVHLKSDERKLFYVIVIAVQPNDTILLVEYQRQEHVFLDAVRDIQFISVII